MTSERMDQIIGTLLRVGVTIAAAVVLAGGIWYLAANGEGKPDYRTFHPRVQGLSALATLPHAEALILLGLLILIATPVARVVFSLVAFILEGDRLYVAFTITVLVVLLYSLGTSWL